MTITKQYARRLIKSGKAKRSGFNQLYDGTLYIRIIRLDLNRIDHYLAI